MSLWVEAQVLASTDRLLALGGGDPVLKAEVTNTGGQQHRIEVYARAIFTVGIRVVVNGQPLSRGYV
ncbi:hypothetical protein [Deinococcus enclensis]|uniref:Uncharacterized protein n=1 Tax=Deinococcus enclensis TaxID=1049582 RepID=A0ABT9MEZ9_9DEIO|nr:hypothetical protein [Deinococcus enclensis]MDP9765168.1 hypothetical protein [Deinococcus enclensis]